MSLRFASLLTLGYFAAGLASLVCAVLILLGDLSIGIALAATAIANLVAWLMTPWINDRMMRWFHRARFLAPEEAAAQPWWGLVQRIAAEHRITPPRFAVIDDANPAAFTYGSTAHRARIVFTRGLAETLAPREFEAVIAHELGHVVNRDFIVMAIASTALQMLYQIYAWAMRIARQMRKQPNRKGSPAGALVIIAAGAWILHWIGTYVLLQLSRVREYAADEFAARATGDGNLLALALLKIAHGIATTPDSEDTAKLLHATRSQGIFDNARAAALASIADPRSLDIAAVEQALAFDVVSPWAWLVQLRSTHPLIGRRLERLMRFTPRPLFDFARIRALAADVPDLRRGVARDMAVYALPWIGALAYTAAFAWGAIVGNGEDAIGLCFLGLVIFVAGVIARVRMRYPTGAFAASDVRACLSDITASPIRGRPVTLRGTTIGRGEPGFILSEDMMFRDRTGLIFLNYESGVPLIGNLIFAWRRLDALVGAPATAEGWFLRGASHHLELATYRTADQTIQGRARLWAWIGAIAVAIGGVLLAAIALPLQAIP